MRWLLDRHQGDVINNCASMWLSGFIFNVLSICYCFWNLYTILQFPNNFSVTNIQPVTNLTDLCFYAAWICQVFCVTKWTFSLCRPMSLWMTQTLTIIKGLVHPGLDCGVYQGTVCCYLCIQLQMCVSAFQFVIVCCLKPPIVHWLMVTETCTFFLLSQKSRIKCKILE